MADDVFGYMQEAGCKGRLTLSINPFIPKPFTPFQWMPMAHQKEVTKKLNSIKKEEMTVLLIFSLAFYLIYYIILSHESIFLHALTSVCRCIRG